MAIYPQNRLESLRFLISCKPSNHQNMIVQQSKGFSFCIKNDTVLKKKKKRKKGYLELLFFQVHDTLDNSRQLIIHQN